MKNNLIVFSVIVVLVAAVCFFAGTKYQPSQRPGAFSGQNGVRGRTGFGTGANANNRSVRGEIISADHNNITVKLSDGSSKIVFYSDKSIIDKATQGSSADLKTGEQVMVFGSINSDGSVTAQNIQLNPQFPGGVGGPNRGNGNR